jgi:hypothetical protein
LALLHATHDRARRDGRLAWISMVAAVAAAPWGCASVAGSNGGIAIGDASAQPWHDGGVILFDAAACQPGDVLPFAPTAYVHAAAPSDACQVTASGNPADAIFDGCFGASATPAGCAYAVKNNDPCWRCIDTTVSGAAAYGPVLADGTGIVRLNVAGCIELSDPSAIACAKALEAKAECDVDACEANCPVIRYSPAAGTQLTAYEACTAVAELGGCQNFAAAAATACQGVDAGPRGCSPAGIPVQAGDGAFEPLYRTAVALFCQVPPALDASMVDASTFPDGFAQDASSAVDASIDDAGDGGD